MALHHGGNTPFRGALVRKASDQTGANYSSATPIAWDQEVYDNIGAHDNVTNNTRLTVPAGAAYVRLSARVHLANFTADLFARLYITKDGATFDGAGGQTSEAGTASPYLSCVSAIVPVTPGQYFEAGLLVETDTSIDITAATSWFAMEVVG